MTFFKRMFAKLVSSKPREDRLSEFLAGTETNEKKQIFQNIAHQANEDQRKLMERAGKMLATK